MAFLLQSGLLALSFLAVFAWQSSPLSQYTIQAIAILMLIYLISSITKKGLQMYAQRNQSLSIFMLNSIVFLLIFATGGFTSSFFFLLYFLIFGVAFVFEPLTVFTFVIGACLVFFPQAMQDDVFSNMIRLGSLLLISPLGYFFGKEYKEREKEEAKIEQAATKIKVDAQHVILKEGEKLPSEQVGELKEIVKEAEELKQA